MTVINILAGVAVNDLDAAKAWYTKLLGRSPDTHPMDDLYEWQFTVGGWLQVFRNSRLAGSSSVTLVENDFEARVGELKATHTDIKHLTMSDAINIAIISDPEGNQVAFAQGSGERHRSVD